VKVDLLCVGDVRGNLKAVVAEYEDRASHYWRFQVTEVSAGMGKGRKVQEDAVRRAEEERLMALLPEIGGVVVALTRNGKPMESRALAAFMEEQAVRSVRELSFIIGGAFGLGERILDRASLKLSLSPMTLPHELARLFLVEQLYRAGTILRNEPYHKGS
jgi:23S rRNA (pseudouridine1915-N3)-methyltransferase